MLKLRQTIGLKQQLKLSQILSPRMIQMLKTFQMSYADLAESAATQVKENVLLEVVRYDTLSTEYLGRRKGSEGFQGKDFSEYTAAKSDKDRLDTYLMSQLDMEKLSPKDHKIAEFLISHVNDRGYLDAWETVSAEAQQQFSIDTRKLNQVLKVIQSFEPEGVGARTVSECLLIQLEQQELESDRLRQVLKQVITAHLESIGDQRYAEVAKSLGIEPEGVEAISDFIRNNLNPSPGSSFSDSDVAQVVPSFEAYVEDEKLVITNLEETKGLQLGLNSRYMAMLQDPGTDQETKAYLEERFQKAKELIEHIQRRRETIQRLAVYVIEKQRLFMHYGPLYLEPLLQKDVAQYLGLSNSTVSRIVSGKYIQTPHGTFALKQLCPRGHFGKTSVRLRQIVHDLGLRHPDYSDEKLRVLLCKMGLDMARRTIAKYRKLSGTESSYYRASQS
jgi:RNA polymerase sigma-54 factor